MKLVNANPKPKVSGAEELPGKVNYFLGNDPKNGRTKVSTFEAAQGESFYLRDLPARGGVLYTLDGMNCNNRSNRREQVIP